MSQARPFISTPEADALSASSPGALSASHPNGSGNERDGIHAPNTAATTSPGHLGEVIANRAQEQTVKLTHEARRQATVNLEQQTRRAARIVAALGTALHEAGNHLRTEDEQLAARYYDMAGDRIDHLATTIERQDAEQLLNTVQRLARRQPVLFVSAAAVIGIVGVRALKSSASSSDQARRSQALHAGSR